MPASTKRFTFGIGPTGDGVPSGDTTLTGSPSASPSCLASSPPRMMPESVVMSVRPSLSVSLSDPSTGTWNGAPSPASEPLVRCAFKSMTASSRSAGTPRTTTPETLAPLLSITWL